MSFYVRVLGSPAWPDCYWSPEKNVVLNNTQSYSAILPRSRDLTALNDNTTNGAGRTLRVYVVLTATGAAPRVGIFTQIEGHGKWASLQPSLDTMIVKTGFDTTCSFMLSRPDLNDNDRRAFYSAQYDQYITRLYSSAMAKDVLGRSSLLSNDGLYTLEWQLGTGVVIPGVDYYIKTDTIGGYRVKAVESETLVQSLETGFGTRFRFEPSEWGTTPDLASTTYGIWTDLGWCVCVSDKNGTFEARWAVYEWETITLMPSPTQDGRMCMFTQYPPYEEDPWTVYNPQRFIGFSMTDMSVNTELYDGSSTGSPYAYHQCFDVHPVVAG